MISARMLGPFPRYASPEYSTHAAALGSASSSITQTVALDAPSLATAFVLCVRAVYEAQRTPEARTFAIMRVHHKASVEEDTADGVTWWSRACHTGREAFVLLDSAVADLLLQDADMYTRPPPKKKTNKRRRKDLKPRPCTATLGSVLTDSQIASQAW